MSGRCLEDIQKVSGGNLECVRKVTGKSQDSVWRLSGRCFENVKIILSVWRIQNILLGQFSSTDFFQSPTKLLNLTELALNGVGDFKVSGCCFYFKFI